jgi:transposase
VTSRLESLAIALLLEMSTAAVACRLALGWDADDAIVSRAAKRGRVRRVARVVRHIGIDENAIKKGHKYFTLVSDVELGELLMPRFRFGRLGLQPSPRRKTRLDSLHAGRL